MLVREMERLSIKGLQYLGKSTKSLNFRVAGVLNALKLERHSTITPVTCTLLESVKSSNVKCKDFSFALFALAIG